MVEVLALLAIGAIAVVAFIKWKQKSDDAALVQMFIATHALARSPLPGEQIVALTAEIAEIKQIELTMVNQGVDARTAGRMSMQGCVRSMLNRIELNRIMPG